MEQTTPEQPIDFMIEPFLPTTIKVKRKLHHVVYVVNNQAFVSAQTKADIDALKVKRMYVRKFDFPTPSPTDLHPDEFDVPFDLIQTNEMPPSPPINWNGTMPIVYGCDHDFQGSNCRKCGWPTPRPCYPNPPIT